MGRVLGYLKGLHATHLIKLGVELGLFDAIREHAPLMPSALADSTGLHGPYVRVWCETACGLELLDYDAGKGYRLAPFMDQILADPNGAFSLRNFANVHLTLARDYERYPHHFSAGSTFPFGDHDETFLGDVASALDVLPRMFLVAVLPNLPELQAALEAGAKVLDVGCGAGAAIIEFAERFPSVRCVGEDIERTSLGMAEKRIAARGLGDRVSTRFVEAGQPWPSDLTDGSFDLVMSYLVLHEIDPSIKLDVLTMCAQALAPDGYLLLFDERYPSDPAELRDPTQVLAVMAQWYEVTWGNVLNTREEINELLANVGMGVIQETALSRFHIVVARRPRS